MADVWADDPEWIAHHDDGNEIEQKVRPEQGQEPDAEEISVSARMSVAADRLLRNAVDVDQGIWLHRLGNSGTGNGCDAVVPACDFGRKSCGLCGGHWWEDRGGDGKRTGTAKTDHQVRHPEHAVHEGRICRKRLPPVLILLL